MGNKPILPQAFVFIPQEETNGNYLFQIQADTFHAENIITELELFYIDVLDKHYEPIVAALRHIEKTSNENHIRHTQTYLFDNSKYQILKVIIRNAEPLPQQLHYEKHYHQKCYLHLLHGTSHSGYYLRG